MVRSDSKSILSEGLQPRLQLPISTLLLPLSYHGGFIDVQAYYKPALTGAMTVYMSRDFR